MEFSVNEQAFDDLSVEYIKRNSHLRLIANPYQHGIVGKEGAFAYKYDLLVDNRLLHSTVLGIADNRYMLSPFDTRLSDDCLGPLLLRHLPSQSSERVSFRAQYGGNLDEGGLSMRVTRTSDYFVWSDFWYETDHSAPEVFESIDPIRFDRAEYTAVIESADPAGKAYQLSGGHENPG